MATRSTDRFIKVINTFPDHPKTLELSDKAFRHLVTMWCYCSRHLTDGKVPLKIFNKTTVKVRKELIGSFAEVNQDYVQMHDYLNVQQSRADVEKTSQVRKVAGQKGGFAKASGKQNASNLLSKKVPDVDIDVDIDVEKKSSLRNSYPQTPTTIPENFRPNNAGLAWAKVDHPLVDVKAETRKFIDYHLSRGTESFDWQAAWRGWIAKATEFAKTRPQPEKSMWDLFPKFQADPNNPEHAYLFEEIGEPVFGEGAGAKLYGDEPS